MKPEDIFNISETFTRQNHQINNEMEMFSDLDATELYCPICRQAVPVRKHLLLVLPEGEKYEYRCVFCAESVGTKLVKNETSVGIIV